VVVQAGEDGAEGVVVQRLRRRPVPASAAAAAAATAPLRGEASTPAPAAARLHVSLSQQRLVKGDPFLPPRRRLTVVGWSKL
jgi:hypothetical protein